MKERVLKLLRKCKAKDYYTVWEKGLTYQSEFRRDGFCNDWNYYYWAGMVVHHNIVTDKIVVFCDEKVWRE